MHSTLLDNYVEQQNSPKELINKILKLEEEKKHLKRKNKKLRILVKRHKLLVKRSR
jgi:hypothetical protein